MLRQFRVEFWKIDFQDRVYVPLPYKNHLSYLETLFLHKQKGTSNVQGSLWNHVEGILKHIAFKNEPLLMHESGLESFYDFFPFNSWDPFSSYFLNLVILKSYYYYIFA